MREMCAYFSLNCLWRQDFALPSGGFLNCYWLIKNWLRYSSLKRSLKFLEEDWCLTLNTQCAAFTLRQRFLPFFYVKSSSNIRANDSFEICLSWGFQNTPNMLNLMKFWLRYLMLKTIDTPSKFNFISTLLFRKLSLAFNLEYLSNFFIKFKDLLFWNLEYLSNFFIKFKDLLFWNLLIKRILKLSLILEIAPHPPYRTFHFSIPIFFIHSFQYPA